MRTRSWKIALTVIALAAVLWIRPAPAGAALVGDTFTVDQSSANALTNSLCSKTANAPLPCVYNANVMQFRYQSQVNQTIGGGDGFTGPEDSFTEAGWA